MVMQAQASPLVQGAAQAASEPQWVRATRAFLLGGKRIEPGTQVKVPRSVADEVVGSNKAVRCEAPAEPQPVQPARKQAAKE